MMVACVGLRFGPSGREGKRNVLSVHYFSLTIVGRLRSCFQVLCLYQLGSSPNLVLEVHRSLWDSLSWASL
jgi:hypothetical protein